MSVRFFQVNPELDFIPSQVLPELAAFVHDQDYLDHFNYLTKLTREQCISSPILKAALAAGGNWITVPNVRGAHAVIRSAYLHSMIEYKMYGKKAYRVRLDQYE